MGEVPVIFGMNRRKLGRACLRKVPVSCVAIMNPQGSDETYKSMLNLASELRQQYQERLEKEIEKLTAEDSGIISPKSVKVESTIPKDLCGKPADELPVSRASSVLSLQAPDLCHLGKDQGTSTMEKTQMSEVVIIMVRRMKVNCSTSSRQAVISPCSCPHGNPTLGTGGKSGDTLHRL